MSQIIDKDVYRKIAISLLNRRYESCNNKGHKDIINGVCNSCFRHYPQTEQHRRLDRINGLIKLIDSIKEFNVSKRR